MTSCGEMTLPIDFDILRPSRSIRKPCVSTSRNGGRPRVASATSSELWNQPRCWSLPSRYMSDGQARFGVARQHGLVARPGVEPDVEDVALALERRAAARRARQAGGQELLDRPLVPGVGAVLVEHRRRLLDERRSSAPPRRTSCSPPPGSARPTRAGARCTSRAGSSPC